MSRGCGFNFTNMDIQTAQQWIIALCGLVIATAALGLLAVNIATRQSNEFKRSAEYWRSEAERLHNQLKGKL